MDNAHNLPQARKPLSASHKGYVLFTTRDQAAGMIAASIESEEIDRLDPKNDVIKPVIMGLFQKGTSFLRTIYVW